MIKALAFDMDGTLLNSKHKVSEETKKAITAAQKAGIIIVLASGRAPMRMEKIAKDLNIDWIVSFNGGTVKNVKTDEVIIRATLKDSSALAIYDFTCKEKLGLIMYKDGRPYSRKKGILGKIVGESQGVKILPLPRKEISGIDKMFFGTFRKKKTSKAAELAREIFDGKLEITQSTSRSVEFNPKGIHKANGLDRVAALIDIKPEEFAVFGDGGNDIQMFKWAGVSIAVSNARKEILNIADEIIGDNNSDAIAKWINKEIKNRD